MCTTDRWFQQLFELHNHHTKWSTILTKLIADKWWQIVVITTISGHHNIADACLQQSLPHGSPSLLHTWANSQPNTLSILPLSLLTLHTTKNLATTSLVNTCSWDQQVICHFNHPNKLKTTERLAQVYWIIGWYLTGITATPYTPFTPRQNMKYKRSPIPLEPLRPIGFSVCCRGVWLAESLSKPLGTKLRFQFIGSLVARACHRETKHLIPTKWQVSQLGPAANSGLTCLCFLWRSRWRRCKQWWQWRQWWYQKYPWQRFWS